MLIIKTLVLGPVQTNAYIIADPENGEAAVVDPSWSGDIIAKTAQSSGWNINQIWLTHAHFDHIGGVGGICDFIKPSPSVALHKDDLPLWNMQGGAIQFGFRINPGPAPTVDLSHHQCLTIGKHSVEVRHTPGHTPGHVIFYIASEKAVFCGDVIFQGSIGRTDLPGGDYATLLTSIQLQVMSLPDETTLFSGHGPITTVGEERLTNPFL